ncbi:MAG: DNA-processing protein DprA [Steroidobacteraceae bacterium]
MDDLFACAEFSRTRAMAPLKELGAYEALWARQRTTFRSLARLFREHPDSLPSDLVPEGEADEHRRRALDLAAAAGVDGLGVSVRGMPAYPQRLRAAAHPVEVLYHQGKLPLLTGRCIAIVGTRHPSRDGTRRAAFLARHLAKAGFVLLSGLAQGIDTAVHVAAIEAGGLTAAVLGTPLTACFPPGNAGLQRQLAREFLLVSQVPIVRYARQTVDENRQFFRERNATLAALAEATIVVEAGERSGALIPARYALEQGRTVFILDHCFRDPALIWPGRLAERGAIRVRKLEDIESRLAA